MSRKRIAIGLDLGTNSIKCAVVEIDGNSIRKLLRQELPSAPDERSYSAPVKEFENGLKSLLAQCGHECASVDRRVITGVGGHGTFLQYLEFPPLSNKELDVSVPFEIQKRIPLSLEDITINYVTVPQLSPGKKKSAVLAVAALKREVTLLKSILENSGIVAERVEIPALALAREFTRNHEIPRESFAPLIHIGFRSSQIVIVRNGYPYYARELPIAGRDFTYAFQMGRQSGWSEAEQYKRSYNIANEESAIEPFLSRLAGEIKKSLEFFSREFEVSACSMPQIFLSGGTALLTGLDKYLSKNTGALWRTVQVDKWDRLRPQEKCEAVLYKVAVGLALGY